ncbi:sensor histidine kinase [Clostridium grantii]|uniref:histidine kinase n=1 Tax=Clostridium grantii DSM 8605 TaxID=1121316 RepID=A0A1M5VUV1_9CLOT|nr:sensor histidine kinase [Clostridium grantii]SHH78703.1 two-component system, sensor histidine kinase YesM [Clostridium grantii DSM 8605]
MKFIKKILNSIQFKSLQFVISMSYSILIISAMLFIGITLSKNYSDNAIEKVTLNNDQFIEQVNLNLNFYIKTMMETSNTIQNSIITNDNIFDEKLTEQINVILSTRTDIVSINIFSSEGELLLSTPSYKTKEDLDVKNQEWFLASIKKQNNYIFSSPHVQNIYEGKYDWVLSLSKSISPLNSHKTSESIVILVDMNFKSINDLCTSINLGEKGYIFITDRSGNIVFHSQQPLIYNGLKIENTKEILDNAYGSFIQDQQNVKRLITRKPIKNTNWDLVGVYFIDEINETINSTNEFLVYIIIVVVIVSILISAFISSKISKPIKELEISMKKVEEGKFDTFIDIKGETEVEKLSESFNVMVKKIKELMDQIVVEQELKRKSELNTLQAQINPHFLYNTLDSIVWMAENEKTDDVIIMVTALAKLFRISLSKGKNIITVKEELEHVKNYLIIQKRRYVDKFEFSFEIDESTLNYKTLKLILQPIIENSIYHGIKYMVDEGNIKISVFIKDNKLVYLVEDNGVGMDKETLEKLQSTDLKENKMGVGVKNVNQRLKLLYGDEYGIEIKSELEEGTIVQLLLPIIEEERKN